MLFLLKYESFNLVKIAMPKLLISRQISKYPNLELLHPNFILHFAYIISCHPNSYFFYPSQKDFLIY